MPLFVTEYEGMPEWADGNRELLAHGAMALRRSRKSGRAALDRVLAAMQREPGEPGDDNRAHLPAPAAQTTRFGS